MPDRTPNRRPEPWARPGSAPPRSASHPDHQGFSAGKGILVMAAGGVLAALLAVAPPSQVSGVAPALEAGSGECTLALSPAVVRAGGDPVEVAMTSSEEIPRPDSIHFASGSGLTGELLEERPMNATVRPLHAEPGEWLVTLHAEQDTLCRGLLTVEADTTAWRD